MYFQTIEKNVYTIFSLSTHQSVVILGGLHGLATVHSAAMNMKCRYLFETAVSFTFIHLLIFNWRIVALQF